MKGSVLFFFVPPNSRISNQKYKNRNPSPVAVTGALAEVGRAGRCAGAGRPAAEGVAAVSILQRARVVAVRGALSSFIVKRGGKQNWLFPEK